MASFASRPPANRRPGKLVKYGKASRSTYSTKHIDNFLEDEDDISGPAIAPEGARTSRLIGPEDNVKPARPVQKPQAGDEEQRLNKTQSKKPDTFDVPSSDDEVESPIRRRLLPKLRSRRTLIDDSETTKLAPWEVVKPNKVPIQEKSVLLKRDHSKGARELQKEASRSLGSDNDYVTTASPVKTKSDPNDGLTKTKQDAKPVSAMARLAQRKKLLASDTETDAISSSKANLSVAKRVIPEVDEGSLTSRKRPRKGVEKKEDIKDMVISNDELLACDTGKGSDIEKDVFDVPESSADESASPITHNSAKPTNQRKNRNRPTGTARSILAKGLSAPARLSEMMQADADNTEAPSRSPSETLSRSSTPKMAARASHGSSTAALQKSESVQTAIRRPNSRNHTQSTLWDQLLPDEMSAPSPSKLPIKDLKISVTPPGTWSLLSKQPRLKPSKPTMSERPRKRSRLVDRMKAAAQSSSEDESSETSDVEMEDTSNELDKYTQSKKLAMPNETSSLSTHPQSQSTANGERGPAITYASARSYIQEDSLDDIMLDLNSITPQRAPAAARRTGQVMTASHKPEFDLEPSDDESAVGRIRTIHELRAAGRNRSFMLDTESLLEDIANHTVSARSRRRSAFVEIAAKLADKAYAGRFLDQGFEDRLVLECTSTPDEMADPVLAAAICFLLSAEPPQHTLASLKSHNVLPWLVRMASIDTEVNKLVKDRRNNMSKVGQGSVLSFFDSFRANGILWEHKHPETVTPRLISLKALELLVGRLRRLGDRSTLMSPDDLHMIARSFDDSDVIEVSLSISVLEALSTSSEAISWPSVVLEQFALIVPDLETTEEMPRHTTFLALRLALNLTNDNAANCNALSQPQTVDYLLAAIQTGFSNLKKPNLSDERDLNLDLLVLALGVMINLAEHSERSRNLSSRDRPKDLLTAIIAIFKKGQEHALDAESVEDTTTNVAFGYLAVMLANICQNTATRMFIRSKLPQHSLIMLVEAVREFVRHHERVDSESFDNEEGREVWGAFTAKLKAVQEKLEAVVRND